MRGRGAALLRHQVKPEPDRDPPSDICLRKWRRAAASCCKRTGDRIRAARASVAGDEDWDDVVEQFVVTQNGVDVVPGSASASHLAGLWAQLRVPDSPTRRRWDLMIYVLVLYTVFYFSFSSAFASAFPLPVLGSDYAVDCMFALDMLLNSRSFFYLYVSPLRDPPAVCVS